MEADETNTTWNHVFQVYWRVAFVLVPTMLPALYFGGWALRSSTALFGGLLVILYPLRHRFPKLTVLIHLFGAYITALIQLVLPGSAVITVLPSATWRPALAIFATVGIYSLGMYGGWRLVIAALAVAVAVFASDFISNVPILIAIVLGAAAGTAVRSVIVELAISRDQLTKHALTDPLTGLGNRRALEREYSRYFNVAKRESASLFISLWDLDNLKQINDQAGHSHGDAMLIDFANVLRSVLREGDALFRIGGDEFCGLHLGLQDGASLIERVHRVFSSVSVGFSDSTELGLEEALKQADAIMYRHKRRRRDGQDPAGLVC